MDFREEDNKREKERLYKVDQNVVPSYADFGEHPHYVKIIRCLFHNGPTSIANLARRTKISPGQTRTCVIKLEESGVVEGFNRHTHKGRIVWDIKGDFRSSNPDYPDEIQTIHDRYVDQLIVESIPPRRWYSIDNLKTNKKLLLVIRKHDLKWKEVGEILNSDDFYRSSKFEDGIKRVARKYGEYGREVTMNEIKVYVKRKPKSIKEEDLSKPRDLQFRREVE